MDAQALIDRAGSVIALAGRLGVSQQTVYNWKAKGIPETRQSWIRERAPELAQAAQDGSGATISADPPVGVSLRSSG